MKIPLINSINPGRMRYSAGQAAFGTEWPVNRLGQDPLLSHYRHGLTHQVPPAACCLLQITPSAAYCVNFFN